MEKVSIIMPCYNDGKYIEQAVESVYTQTYPNIELIIIDDGSDDIETIKEINRIQQTTDALVLHTTNVGPAAARNYGIEHSKGAYILPLDSDDIIDASYVEKAVAILESNSNIGVVYCLADLFGELKGRWELPPYSFQNMLVDNVVFVTAMFYKRDWVLVGGYDITMDVGMEDYAFWIAILALDKEIYQIQEVLFHYRIKKESRTTKFLSDENKTKEIYKKLFMQHKKFYEKHFDEYAMALRDSLIEQIYVRRKYERRFEKIRFIKKIPILNRIVRRIVER